MQTAQLIILGGTMIAGLFFGLFFTTQSLVEKQVYIGIAVSGLSLVILGAYRLINGIY